MLSAPSSESERKISQHGLSEARREQQYGSSSQVEFAKSNPISKSLSELMIVMFLVGSLKDAHYLDLK